MFSIPSSSTKEQIEEIERQCYDHFAKYRDQNKQINGIFKWTKDYFHIKLSFWWSRLFQQGQPMIQEKMEFIQCKAENQERQ